MQPLEKSLRNLLEKTVKEAREVAEDAARAALTQLGVGEALPFPHLTEGERELRRKLRAHGRQLGDRRDPENETQDIARLVEEVAYEHWHRMLFARFLAENNLLMYPDPDDPVPITLEECEDLAADEGAKNGWELAARFAAQMLPQIFRPDSPVFQLELPPEHQQKLERLLVSLPTEVFTASDSLGWVYQFWQAKKKDEVNASEVKIGARELPAVTQLFTEPYMVSFLLDNSLGAWWAAHRLTPEELKNASSEEELRQKAALPGVPLEYLRFVRLEDGTWTPAAGTFDGWPEHLRELKTLDPCCGSGHFLVAALLMLVPMRMELEGLTAREAVDAVLRDNLHGLEIDQRCVELAAFALALTAWRYPGAGGYRKLPELNLACSGLSISAKKDEWLALADDNTNLRLALEELYKQFKDAPVLGSLINPEISLGKGSLFELKWEEVGPLLAKALSGEKDDERSEMGVVAQGVAKASSLLTKNFDLVTTNVPYLGIRKQNDFLKEHFKKYYDLSKGDLATVFLDKFLRNNVSIHGCYAVVTPSAFANKDYFKSLRKYVLETYKLTSIAILGPRAFETITGEVVDVILLTIEKESPKKDSAFMLLDVFDAKNTEEKSNGIKRTPSSILLQSEQLSNPDYRIQQSSYGGEKLLLDYCDCPQGIKTGDDEKWIRRYWELSDSREWEFCQSSSKNGQEFGGLEKIINWSTQGRGMIRPRLDSLAVGKWAVGLSQTGQKRPVLFLGARFDSNIAPVLPNDPQHLLPIWTFCSSPEFLERLEENSRGLFTTNTALLQVPFNLDRWTKVAQEKYPNGLPKPYSNDPTQWIFHGHPCGSVVWDEDKKWTAHGPLRTDATVLQVAVARLLGYRWPAELDVDMELADEQREWVKRCKKLLPFADEDGIVCIPPVRGEQPADERLLGLLAAAYGDDWNSDILSELLASADHAGKTLETWLRDKFFAQHCKLFHHRPFIWHIWDGLRDGFAVLVNYHKLDRKNLETLIYTYLGDWINRQKRDCDASVDGAEEKLAAAISLKKKLELILKGESPHDIFVRWKPIEKQPIGWEPDLNDGVRLNIRPFMTVGDVKKKGAGILRDKPNIHWKKDRGKDVESAPWYHLGPQYGGKEGDRINDHHLTLEEKRKARKEAVHE